jgi:hypothetical protein
MARLFVDYVPDKIIIKELKLYHAYDKALQSGVPQNERPLLPEPARMKMSRFLSGVVLHSANYILRGLSEMLGVVKAQEWLARNRITTDDYSSEPMSCGIHKSYTRYGLARLAQGDVVSAIQSLSYSTKIHPCLHSTTYGLSYALRNRLLSYAEAEDAIQLFDVIAWRFGGRERYRQSADS